MSNLHRGRGSRGGGGGPPRGRGTESPAGSQTSSTGGGYTRGRGNSPAPGGIFTGGNRGGGRGGARGGPPQIFGPSPARVDSRLSTSSALVASFKRLGVQDEMPLRPGWGTKGQPRVVRANFFAVRIPKDLTIYEYDVTISPEKEPTSKKKGTASGGPQDKDQKQQAAGLRARLFQLLEQHPDFQPYVGHIAHDRSKKIVSARLLPAPLSIRVTHFHEEEAAPRPNSLVYVMNISFTTGVDSNSLTQYMDGRPEHRKNKTLPLISALNLILQQHAARTGVRFGKNRYFFPTLESHPLSLGLEAKKGFFLSVRPTYKQLMVNINVCMTAFYTPGNLAMAMLAFIQHSRGGMPNEFAYNMKITASYRGYPMKRAVKRIGPLSARKTKFDCQEFGGEITVEQYFKKKFNITLEHPDDVPVVVVGNSGKPNHIPAELCDIAPNQPFFGTLPDTATAAMIKVACNQPHINGQSIVFQGFPALGIQPNNPQGPLRGFNIEVSSEMATIPVRLLAPPGISYRSGKASVRDASWNILDVKFHKGGDMKNWAVLLVTEGREPEFRGADDPDLAHFLQTFAKKCRDSGMNVPPGLPKIIETPKLPSPHSDQRPNRGTAMGIIMDALKKQINPQQKPSFILVLLSGIDKFIYPNMKRVGDVMLGMHTVHMLLTKARGDPKKQDQYFSNVALKVNIKLNGINHLLDDASMGWLKTKKTMLVGIDVTHPSPRSRQGTPSVAAVVASVDDNFVQFPASLGLQRNAKKDKNAEEMVQILTDMMCERLALYKKRNKKLPERVIVYRDGVSEGQFPLVNTHELPQIREAFKKLGGPVYRPTLSILICGKRHHARTFPTTPETMTRNGNTPAGTVCDQGITDVYNHDFYLQAHNGLQGHVRPTHYTVVYDENHLDADTIQEGTHRTSYLYARATKAVSLVPPAYYADLACDRARFYINHLLNLADNKSVSSKGRASDEEREQVFQEAIKWWGNGVHSDLRESMFYI